MLRKRYEEHKRSSNGTGAFISGEVLLRRAQGASNIKLKVEREEDTDDDPVRKSLGSSPLEKGSAVSETALGLLRSVSWDMPGQAEAAHFATLHSSNGKNDDQVSQVAAKLNDYLEQHLSEEQDTDNSCILEYGVPVTVQCTTDMYTESHDVGEPGSTIPVPLSLPEAVSHSLVTSPRIDEGYDTMRTTEKVRPF